MEAIKSMKILITILFFILYQNGFCQTNKYTAYWSVTPNSNVTLFNIQRSSDNTNWVTAITINTKKDSLNYNADFNAYPNNFIRISAITPLTTWTSKEIQVTAVLPVVFSNVSIRKIIYLQK